MFFVVQVVLVLTLQASLNFKTEALQDRLCNTNLSHKILACEFDIFHKRDLEKSICIENMGEVATLSKHGTQLRILLRT